ncbi:hypothetical protein SCLCIDRAFT_102054 [Scleroderma citrinum Foug A]|uniref:GDP-fucose protein O-fucosyltransferase 2 n=1 Tax=Scleroderma citrinum Foug A TaxID=1036808 RepID=A0A0C3ER02_9AGAM|nr:hypothetical protein SCLCIDRAFT_102054 [Scleroderma citrinum Foug A]
MLVKAPAQLRDLLTVPPVTDLDDVQSYVLGPPTQSFRDNLRNDTKYITSWLNAGWTNDVMTIGNLLYLAMITERVPILPRFIPSHIGPDALDIPFGHVFDVPRLSKAIGLPILEWEQVKDVDSTVVDELGCWALWPVVAEEDIPPRGSSVVEKLKLDLSHTLVPGWVKLTQPGVPDKHASLWSLARLSFPEARVEALKQPPIPSPLHQASLPPDEQLLCFDYLYYTAVTNAWEWNWDYSPAWRFVGRHMHWNATLVKLAEEHVRRAMQVPDNELTPAYISIHVRHGDFRSYCNSIPEDQCFASISVIARRVEEVQQELLDRKGIHVTRVIMTSDERDPNWWAEIAKLGWTWVDYAAERTVEKHGKWYPLLLDAIIQSRGAGFVGTEYSTMTTVALRRVQDWSQGAVRVTHWGWPGADDH